MTTPNFPNRTLAIMDNLEFLRHLDNESIDLIAIDPPFAANETFEGKVKPPLTKAELGEERALAARHNALAIYEKELEESKGNSQVKDKWFFRKVEQDWMDELGEAGDRIRAYREWEEREARIAAGEHIEPTGAPEKPTARDHTLNAIREVVEAVAAVATENEAAYIALMGVRLYECRRVLKDTGSIYVHCDMHANSYLRILMDAIFGNTNFRNEIAWCYTGPSNTKRWFPRKYDTILFYAKSNATTFNRDAVRVPYKDGVVEKARGKGSAAIWSSGHNEDRVADLAKIGKVPQNWWTEETPGFSPVGRSKENTGYSTQKPIALYQRIVRASSNPGDVVLDLFAGCATTAIAAELEGRNWLACDMAYRANTMLMRRFYQNDIILSSMNVDVVREAIDEYSAKFPNFYKQGLVIGPPDLDSYPRLTSNPDDGVPYLKAPKRMPSRKRWNSPYTKEESKDILIDKWGPICWGCNFDATRPNGTVNLTLLQVDHIQATKSKDGVAGGDELTNLAILCGYCNGHKGAYLSLEELRKDNERDNALYVNHIGDLQPHPYKAREFAREMEFKRGHQMKSAVA